MALDTPSKKKMTMTCVDGSGFTDRIEPGYFDMLEDHYGMTSLLQNDNVV